MDCIDFLSSWACIQLPSSQSVAENPVVYPSTMHGVIGLKASTSTFCPYLPGLVGQQGSVQQGFDRSSDRGLHRADNAIHTPREGCSSHRKELSTEGGVY